MDYAEAKKKVEAEKPKENYMVVKFDIEYNTHLVVPHKDGMALLSALANAEVLYDRYDEQKGIQPITRDHFVSRLMSRAEYLRYKMVQLLGVSPDEIKQQEQPVKPDAS